MTVPRGGTDFSPARNQGEDSSGWNFEYGYKSDLLTKTVRLWAENLGDMMRAISKIVVTFSAHESSL